MPYEFRGFVLDDYMKSKLDAYAQRGAPVGGFLRAVLSNDLSNAVGRADSENLANLPAFVGYIYNNIPADAWGSSAKVDLWQDDGGIEGRQAAAAKKAVPA